MQAITQPAYRPGFRFSHKKDLVYNHPIKHPTACWAFIRGYREGRGCLIALDSFFSNLVEKRR